MRRVKFVTNHYYHIYNRGTEKRTIFQETKDYRRFLLNLSEFNTDGPVHLASQLVIRKSFNEAKPHKKLVDILCYCLLPNHFHLLIKQLIDNGITQFMHKLNTGYAMFFNKKWNHTGRLFEGTFKAKIIEDDAYILHLSRYIHLNPLELIEPHWKEEGIRDRLRVKEFLEGYHWSSYPTYIEKENSKIVSPGILREMVGRASDYEKFVIEWTERSRDKISSLLID